MSTPAASLPRLAVPAALGAIAVGMLAWATVLGATLPSTYAAERWGLAWVGLDLALAGLFATTGWLVRRQDPLAPGLALATATALLADAWFDCSTAGSADLVGAVLMASVELPAAAALAGWAVRTTRRRETVGA